MMTLRLLLMAFAASTATAGQARDWYVSPQGDDGANGGTPATAFRTLQRAEGAVKPGDTVLIGSGVYEGDTTARRPGSALLSIDVSGRPDAWITWKARPGHRPELRPRQWTGIEVHGS